MQIIDALKNLYVAVTGEDEPPVSDQIADVIQAIAEHWPEDTPSGHRGGRTCMLIMRIIVKSMKEMKSVKKRSKT